MSDQVELPLTEIQNKLRQVVERAGGMGKFSGQNAIAHLQRAWAIRHLDPDMAAFRVITADEESATAIFHALKARRYDGAALLDPRCHDHNAAMLPFLAAVERALALAGLPTLDLVLKSPTANPPRIGLRFFVYDASGTTYAVEPVPPLHARVTVNGVEHDFAEVRQVATRAKSRTIGRHIKDLAHVRDQLLYASSQGLPAVQELPDEVFTQAARRVFRNLGIYLCITAYPGRQDFVQQALKSFLRMLNFLGGARI